MSRKNKNQKQEAIPADALVLTNDLLIYSNSIIQKSISLGKHYQDFRQRRNDWRYMPNQDLEAFTQWLPIYQQAHDIDLLKGELEFNQLNSKSALSHAPSYETLFKSYYFFTGYSWPARFGGNLALFLSTN